MDDNGAGNSSRIEIDSGNLPPGAGAVYINDRAIEPVWSADARDAGAEVLCWDLASMYLSDRCPRRVIGAWANASVSRRRSADCPGIR